MSIKATVFGVVGALVLFGVTTSAEARRHDFSDESRWEQDDDDDAPRLAHRRQRSQHVQADRDTGRGRSVGARPDQWCGWWMRTQRGGGPEYNLAWNWSRWGKPTEPKVGAVVVWRHHVGEITGRSKSGQWIVRSGNDGGRVRERARSVAGAVFRI
jgi:hypothetical protein